MTIFKPEHLKDVSKFSKSADQLAIFQRQAPQGADAFMQKLMQISLGIAGKVHKKNALQDVQNIVHDQIPETLQVDPFYERWITDMSEVCTIFCETLGCDAICFWLGSERGCNRYHIDNVPMRLLVTYAGRGTEWLPEKAADRSAFANGAPNEQILIDPSSIQFMNTWDIAVFRGGPEGVLHRTPDAALNQPSLLMRLDPVAFWDNILSKKYVNQS
ncbi:MAG: DUF1826 domain-containing protein [Pseudomonadota bacterium]